MAVTQVSTKYSEPHIENAGFDEELQLPSVQQVAYDGTTVQRVTAKAMATKVVESGNYTYVCIASPGTAQATAKWQCKKIDESVAGTMIITWADGNTEFDNVATDPTALTYS